MLPVDVVGRVLRAVGRDLSPAARYDYEWASVLLAPAGLAPGLVALMALEAATDVAPSPPCLTGWLRLLDAAVDGHPAAFRLREALALAVDARQLIRETHWQVIATSPDPAEAVQTVFAEAAAASGWADELAGRRKMPVAGR